MSDRFIVPEPSDEAVKVAMERTILGRMGDEATCRYIVRELYLEDLPAIVQKEVEGLLWAIPPVDKLTRAAIISYCAARYGESTPEKAHEVDCALGINARHGCTCRPEGAPEPQNPNALPMQPIYKATSGEYRFRENKLVRHMLDHGGVTLNDLAMVDAPEDDRMQLAQLIGYSLSGYSELSYVTDESYERASWIAESMEAPAPSIAARSLLSSESLPGGADAVS